MHLYVNPKGKVLPCCVADDRSEFPNINDGTFEEVYNSQAMNNLRKNMLTDVPSPSCEYCYKLEKYGSHSHRKHSNHRYLELLEPQLEQVVNETNPDGSLKEINILYFDVRFSNVCNYKCRMCGPLFSTKWYEDSQMYFKHKPDSPLISIDNIKDFCERNKSYLKNIRYIYFAGGEPLVQRQHYEFLEWCVDNGVDAEIYYQSNGSTVRYGKYNIFDLWKKFRKVTYSVSIDALGKLGEYIRSGYNDIQVNSNMQQIAEYMGSNKEITVNCTFMIYNAFYAVEFFDEMAEKDWVMISNVYTQLLIGPEYLQPKVLPEPLKKEAIDKIKKSKWFKRFPNKFEQLLSNLEEETDSSLWKGFKRHIEKLDTARKENIFNVCPRLKEYW